MVATTRDLSSESRTQWVVQRKGYGGWYDCEAYSDPLIAHQAIPARVESMRVVRRAITDTLEEWTGKR